MATRAALKANRSVLEGKRTPLVAVTVQAPRLVCPEALRHCRADATVWIVAIDATHPTLGQPMMKWLLEFCPNSKVTTRALLVYRGNLARHQPFRTIGVDFVTRGA
jgi:hypothetical protein